MKHTEKKYYSPPEISEIEIDRVIVLQITSEKPPDLPGSELFSAPSSGTTEEEPTTLKSESFEENPFER